MIKQVSDQEYFKTKDQDLEKPSRRICYMEAVVKKLWRTNSEEKKIRIRGWQEYNSLTTYEKKFQNKTEKEISESPEVKISPSKMSKLENASDLDTLFDLISNDEEINSLFASQPLSLFPSTGYNNNSNLEKLINMLDENNEQELLLKAEAYRHLGLFLKSIELIEKRKFESHLNSWKKVLIALAQKKVTKKQQVL